MAPESLRFGGSYEFGMLQAILRAAARQPGAGATGRDPEYDESGLQVFLAGPCRGSVIREIFCECNSKRAGVDTGLAWMPAGIKTHD